MSGKYDSLLRRGRHFSEKHPPMPNCERAAQFAPFAALNGFEEAVDETASGRSSLTTAALRSLTARSG